MSFFKIYKKSFPTDYQSSEYPKLTRFNSMVNLKVLIEVHFDSQSIYFF